MLLNISNLRSINCFPWVIAPLQLNKLSALISAVTLLSACSVVQDPNLVLQENPETSREGINNSTRIVTGRADSARVEILAGSGNSETTTDQFENIWARIGSGLSFSLSHDNERIEEQVAYYKDNPAFLIAVTERSRPFIYEIVEELERRSLPLELALLPIVESAYNPNAAAGKSSVGLWQIVNATARSLGIKQDWWYDGRRDPIASTGAALDYLTTLNEMFENDWLLTLAAYNTGQGNVQKAMEQNSSKSRATDYWSLNLASTTEDFVPKLIALARLIATPDHYGLELADVRNERVVARLEAGTQIDLALVAGLAGVDTEILYQLNPGIRQWATPPDGPHMLLVPIDKVDAFKSAVASLQGQASVTWDRYVVQPGDTLSKIARQFHTQVAALQQSNGIDGSRIIIGESLLIPRAYTSAAPLATPNAPEYQSGVTLAGDVPPQGITPPTRYEVRTGDSLWRIANRYNLSTSTLAGWNNISIESVLRPGQILVLYSGPAIAQAVESGGDNDPIKYTVKSGDTIARIARKYGVEVAEVLEWNDIQVEGLIHPGQQLLLHPKSSELN